MFHDPIAVKKFEALQKQFGFQTCFETGTDQGHGAMNASKIVPVVITIEIMPEHRNRAIENWTREGFKEVSGVISTKIGARSFQKDKGMIYSILGNSAEELLRLFSMVDTSPRPYCFYLDAHWGEYWPLLDELRVIQSTGRKDCVIIIHDFKVPGKPWGYDNHGGVDLDWNYVKDHVLAINPNYHVSYNEHAEGNRRGICYITPQAIVRPDSEPGKV